MQLHRHVVRTSSSAWKVDRVTNFQQLGAHALHASSSCVYEWWTVEWNQGSGCLPTRASDRSSAWAWMLLATASRRRPTCASSSCAAKQTNTGAGGQDHRLIKNKNKDENGQKKSRPVPPRPYFYIYPACFRIYGKIRKWDEKRERVYPARICGIPFLSGIIPYFPVFIKSRKK